MKDEGIEETKRERLVWGAKERTENRKRKKEGSGWDVIKREIDQVYYGERERGGR